MNKKIDISGIILETNRLILREWKTSDLNDFYEYASVEGVGCMAGWPRHENIESTRRVLNSFIENKKVFCLVYKLNNKVIGSLGIECYSENELPELSPYLGRELGYVLSKDYWGQGLMTEACQKVIQYLFEEEQLDFITCGAFSYNHRSKRVQEKLGFKYLKTINHPTLLNTVEVCDTTIIYKEEYFLKKKIRLSEESYNSYNCNSIDYGYFIRYTDDEIYDMWDHNFNEVPSYVYNINQNIINQMLEITKIRNEQHLKITSNHELFLDENYFEKGIILTMALDNINNLEELNHNLIYKDVINDHIEEDIYNLDCKYYGDIYGIEYYQRRYHYLFERIKKDSRLNYLGVYLDNKIVGMCYYYIDHDIICLDDLLVEEEYRHHGIARTIIYHLTHKYNLPIYLHADSEDMPKDIYLKMGFKIINQTYEYIHMFNNIDNNIDNNK